MKMNIKISIMLLIAIAVGFILGWYLMPNSEQEKWTPDKINLYYNEEQSQVTKVEDPQFFDQILRLIVFEKGDMMSGGNAPLSEEEVNEMRKSAVEYFYNKPISIQINNGDGKSESIKFKSILFPIDEKWNGAAYIQTTDSTYLYFVSRPSLDSILRHM
ncbi:MULTISPECIES: hypothetical protein [Paenibacillus]|jgi:hypothetical protein|uniref:hypothetical protein n=1 Tax=Paenibacillus TaxID=44249 RepID=UPI00129DAC1C|nr:MULTISPECIES: hypothetical protein [Paenibacillus]WJH26911.1 hypothetical protein N6H13_15955 [Paenibacillus sp. CC-CFT742]